MNFNFRKSQSYNCNVAILAGGKGTRIASRSGDLPKPMLPILGKPVLQHQIELCRKHGFTKIALLVHHQHQVISNFFGDGSRFGVRIRYVVEDTPRGTAGALRDAQNVLMPHFLLLYGDTYLDVDLRSFFGKHIASKADATLFLHPNDHPYDSDIVTIDDDGVVLGIHPYPHSIDLNLRNLVNAALYAVRNEGLERVTRKTGKADIAKDMFPAMLQAGCLLRGFVSSEYIKDMGTPDRLDKVEHDIEVGLPGRLSLRQLRTAVFLDRDGTLNREVNHLSAPDQIQLLPKVGEAIRLLNSSGMLSVLVTNQPVVARGDVTVDGLSRIHARLETLLGKQHAYLDAIYYCPHYPDKGFNGEVPELKIVCECRKPATGLIHKAAKDLAISITGSWMIGDTTSDVEAGRRAGLRTILLRTGYAGSDGKHEVMPDYTFISLLEAVKWITDGHTKARHRMASIAAKILDGYRVVLIGGLARSGKSSAAQVIKELLAIYGKLAHVISLDGWLKPTAIRDDATCVLDRYDIETAARQLSALANATQRIEFSQPVYDRNKRRLAEFNILHSVGTEDVLIVEGVPALYLQALFQVNKSIRLFIETPEDCRQQRLREDYALRGYTMEKIDETLISRAQDETDVIRRSAGNADHLIDWEK